MIRKIFLVGNPNVGKSVVFSRLTGVQVISSNYPGTTVGFTKGWLLLGEEKIEVVDLPGIYSLEPSSNAENVAVRMLKEEAGPDCIVVNVVDATNLERNLFLSLQLLEQGLEVVLCLNMFDETVHKGIHIDARKLAQSLQVPVVPTAAITGVGIKALVLSLKQAAAPGRPKVSSQIRWQEIGSIIESCQELTHRHHSLRELLEDASVRPFSGLMIAAGVIFLSFKVVRFLGESLISHFFDPFFYQAYQPLLLKLSGLLGKEGLWHHVLLGELLNGGIDFKQSMGLLTTAPYIEFAMVLPYMIAFYLVLGLLEDIGFLPRLAMLMDGFMHRLGLHGFTIIPVLLGFGCNVPGILATRMLESKRERFIAATLISIGVPCVPLQAMIFGLLGKLSGFYVAGVYLVLFSLWLVLGIILNRIIKGYSPEFLMEIPPYRFPPLLVIWHKLWMRIKAFMLEAVPIVLIGVGVVNLLLYFHLFDFLTGITAPLVRGLLGLPKEAVVALLIGAFRKDVAVGMLMPLTLTAKQLFISCVLLAISFPCIATFIVMLKELGSKQFLKSLAVMVLAALGVGTILNLAIH